MRDNTSFRRGLLVGVLLMLGSHAVHWLLTPASHPDASLARIIAVGMQAILGYGGALWVLLQRRSATAGRSSSR